MPVLTAQDPKTVTLHHGRGFLTGESDDVFRLYLFPEAEQKEERIKLIQEKGDREIRITLVEVVLGEYSFRAHRRMGTLIARRFNAVVKGLPNMRCEQD